MTMEPFRPNSFTVMAPINIKDLEGKLQYVNALVTGAFGPLQILTGRTKVYYIPLLYLLLCFEL